MHWIRERLPRLGLSENTIEKLISFLGKYGEPEKVLSELRSLTKSESHVNFIFLTKLIAKNLAMITFFRLVFEDGQGRHQSAEINIK